MRYAGSALFFYLFSSGDRGMMNVESPSEAETVLGDNNPQDAADEVVPPLLDAADEVVPPPRVLLPPVVDFLEVYSPDRVATRIALRGGRCGPSCDLTTGFDLCTIEGRAAVLALIAELRPTVLFTSAPCTFYSSLNVMFNHARLTPHQFARKRRDADHLLNFGFMLCRIQARNGRYYVHEHPRNATSWANPAVADLLADGGNAHKQTNKYDFDGAPTHPSLIYYVLLIYV